MMMKQFPSMLHLSLILGLSLNMLHIDAQRQMETLGRGVVAVKVSNGVFISWRAFGTEYLNTTYNLYRETILLNTEPITGATNYLDPAGTLSSTYSVAAVVKGVEQTPSDPVVVWDTDYLDVPLQIPPGGTTPDMVDYTYNANDCSVADLDGDGQYEIILKWDPSNSKDNAHDGYTGNVIIDAYKLDGTLMWRIDLGINIRAGAHYTQFMVYDLDGDGKAEMACKTADGTKDGTGTVIGNPGADYRNSSGYILSGPEFLTVFDGETGAAIHTVNYIPPRGSVSSWGDSYGNRVDRFLACVAYLDGVHPSLVMCRGYYTRAVLAAWDFANNTLTSRWVFDSNNPGYSAYAGQGNHNLSVADVDDDGKDEIIYGACAIDDDGSGLWTTGYGHGDAMHVSDIDPARPGLEKWGIHEGTGTPGSALLDARTGQTLWKTPNEDVGRGVSADLNPSFPGMECWGGTSGLRSAHDEYAGPGPSSSNHVIWWDGDLLRELLDGTGITKYQGETILYDGACSSINGTKSNPCIQADIIGDWREEVVFRLSDNSALRIYTTTSTTDHKIYTLMHDPQYRLSVAWQNVAYNQPPHTGFFLGDGMASLPVPPMMNARLRWFAGTAWDVNVSMNWKQNGSLSYFNEGDDVLFDLSGSNAYPVSLNGILHPSAVTVHSPIDYIFEGPGSLSGSMELLKAGPGTLTLNAGNDYHGKTTVMQGTLLVNGTLSQSPVEVHPDASLGGKGTLGNGLTLFGKGSLMVGGKDHPDTLRISNHLTVKDEATLIFDLSNDTSGVSKPNDLLLVTGDLVLEGDNTIDIRMLDNYLNSGGYTLVKFTGTFTGDINRTQVAGVTGLPYDLSLSGNSILLTIARLRDPANLVWSGGTNNTWDLVNSFSWLNDGISDFFVMNDTVLFDDSAYPNTLVNLTGILPAGKVTVYSSRDYSFVGDGRISGPASLIKNGSGKLTISTQNDYTGPTILNGGYLVVSGMSNAGQAGPFGAATANPSNMVLNGGGILVTGATLSTDRGMTINGANAIFNIAYESGNLGIYGEITGEGRLEKAGDGTLTLYGTNSFTGGTLVRNGTLRLGDENANLHGFGSGTVTIHDGVLSMYDNRNSTTDNCAWNLSVPQGYNATLSLDSRCSLTGTLTGGGTLNLYTPYTRSSLAGNWSAFNGQIYVSSDSDGGFFLIANTHGYGNASVNLSDKVTLLYRYSEDAVIEIGALAGTSASVLGAGGETANTITWVIGGKNTPAVFNGLITDTQYAGSGAKTSVIKTGSADWTLTSANTYSGNTTVNGGILTVNNTSGSATGSGQVTVNGGGVVRGNGTVEGPVTIQNQGSLSAGAGIQYGSLTVNKNATFMPGSYLSVRLDPVSKNADKLVVKGKLVLNGNLYLVKGTSGNYTVDDAFRILDAPDCSGTFQQILPKTPGEGLVWDTTNLCSTGIIRVAEEGSNAIPPDESDRFVRIWPNPASRIIHIRIDDPSLELLSGEVVLKCYDYQGQVCFVKRIPSSGRRVETELEINHLPQGVYVLVITGEKKTCVKRFVRH